MDYLHYKGYSGSVAYSEADNCLYGKVIGLKDSLILYEGGTLSELRGDFEAGIDSYLEGCKADNIAPERSRVQIPPIQTSMSAVAAG